MTITVSSHESARIKPFTVCADRHGQIIGATFTVLPYGTTIEEAVTVTVPNDGLHAIAFFQYSKTPMRMGSGQTAWLDKSTKVAVPLFLAWYADDGKLFLKCMDAGGWNISATDRARFNPFTPTPTGFVISDPDKKVLYTPSTPQEGRREGSDWTHKSVTMEDALMYITKRISLEELDARAQTSHPSYAELLQRNAELGYQMASLQVQLAEKEDELINVVNSEQSISEELMRVKAKLDIAVEKANSLQARLETAESERDIARQSSTACRERIRAMLPLLQRLEKFPRWLLSKDSRKFIDAMRALKVSNKT